jgi:kynureninase
MGCQSVKTLLSISHFSLLLQNKIHIMTFENTLEFAKKLDSQDQLHKYQDEFIFPQVNGKKVIYFTGNSLGLQPKRTSLRG